MGEAKIKKNKPKPHLFIATPMYGGMCAGRYTASMLKLIPLLERKGWQYTFLFRFNESLIDRARNALAANFLASSCTHLLFIDADIGFEADEVLTMVDADKDVICGIYPSKAINWSAVAQAVRNGVSDDKLSEHTGTWVVNFVDYKGDETVKVGEPFEIWNGGTGMMLIKREVFETLEKTVERYRVNEMDPIMRKFGSTGIPRFFATSIDPISNVLLSEDYHFCRLWREAGGKIWAAPWVHLAHVGTYIFEGKPRNDE